MEKWYTIKESILQNIKDSYDELKDPYDELKNSYDKKASLFVRPTLSKTLPDSLFQNEDRVGENMANTFQNTFQAWVHWAHVWPTHKC